MRRPLVRVALLYTAGLLAAKCWTPPLVWLFGISFLFAGVVCAGSNWRAWGLWPLLILAGWTNLSLHTTIVSPIDLRTVLGEQTRPQLVTIQGRLEATPTQRIFLDQEEEEKWHTVAVVEVQAFRQRDGWQPAFGRVAVNTPGVLPPELFAGKLVEVTGVIRAPPGPLAEGLFDYRTYLEWQGIYHQLVTKDARDWQLSAAGTQPIRPPLADRFLNWAQPTLARGLPAEDEPLRLLWAMTLGWKTGLTDEVSEPFMRTGTMHIFAISGLHIALIAGILVALLRVLQVPRGACGWIVIPAIWFYTAATGWQPPAIRSTIMMTVVVCGWTLRRPGDLINSLAASAFIILLWEPRQLFQASFQLSFFVVLSIALLLPLLEGMITRLLQTDPFLPVELIPRWRRRGLEVSRGLLLSFATSLAAWLGSLPLIAWYFHLLTPVSLLANCAIVPLSSLALMCNLGSLVCGGWLPSGAELFNHSAWLFMYWMDGLSRWATNWPGAYFYVYAPGWVMIVVYYVSLIGLLSGWLLTPGRRRWTALGAGLVLLTVVGKSLATPSPVRITVLALHGGSAQFIDAPGRRTDLLVDSGNKLDAERIVRPFLQGQGVNRLPRLVLTHGDLRHVGGAAPIADTFHAQTLYTSHARPRSPSYRRTLDAWEHAKRPRVELARGNQFAGWRVLHPASDDPFPRADDQALVLAGALEGVRVLLLSDLGHAGQEALRQRESDLRADLVVTGLPAQGEPLEDALLEAIQPRLIVVNDATYPLGERAKKPLRDRLALRGVPVLYTSDVGSVTLTLQRGQWQAATMSGGRFSGAARPR